MDIFKVLALCLITAVLAVLLKQYRQEYATFITVAASVTVLGFVFSALVPAVEQLKEILEKSGVESQYLKIALKALGIAYISEFIADTCRDCGQTSMASRAELAGKSAVFLISVPLITSILKTALSFIGE